MQKASTTANAAGRLDKVLRAAFPAWGRRAVDELIKTKRVSVNGRGVWLASWEVAVGDTLTVVNPPAERAAGPTAFDDAWLIHVDDHVVVVDKPAGLRAEATRAEDLTPNLLGLCVEKFGDVTLAHRLDRDTSGIMVLARSARARAVLDLAFKSHAMDKHYVAVVRPFVHGPGRGDEAPPNVPARGVIDLPIGPDPRRRDKMTVTNRDSKPASTRYEIVSRRPERWYVHLWPSTGRTHQLRVHTSAMGMPILGDRLYGDEASAPRLMLHAASLTLPAIGTRPSHTLHAPPPEGFVPGRRPKTLMKRAKRTGTAP